MKKLFLVLSLFLTFLTPAFCADYAQIYEELNTSDFEYIFGLDPYQAEDYKKYYASPYPLLRLGVDFYFKNLVIPRGYYLLTPREKEGVNYVLFKQGGKVVFVIPAYKTELVEPMFYDKHVPQIKKGPWTKFCEGMSHLVGKMSDDSKRAEMPKAYITVDEVGGEFWELILYYGTQKYYLLFKKG